MFDPEYDSGADEITKSWGIVMALVVATILIFTFLGYLAIFTNTFIEHKVFKASHQYQEAREIEMTTYEAQLAEIDVQLTSSNMDEETKQGLRAKRASIAVLQRAAERRN